MLESVKHTIQLYSEHYCFSCELCDESIRRNMFEDDLSYPINHYVQKHDYKLLYIGQYTYDGEKSPVQGVTAILGSSNIPEKKPDAEFGC